MYSLGWSPKGLADLDRLDAFLRAKNPEAATRAIDTIRAAAERLRSFPDSGRPVEGRARQYHELPVRFGSGGYLMFYRFDGRIIYILAVRHFREADYS